MGINVSVTKWRNKLLIDRVTSIIQSHIDFIAGGL
jgi:hypothetical protein